MSNNIIVVVLAFAAAGCSRSFQHGKRDGKTPSVADESDEGEAALAATPSAVAAKDGDCIPGKAKGHTKNKARGKARGHDRPPCREAPGDGEGAEGKK